MSAEQALSVGGERRDSSTAIPGHIDVSERIFSRAGEMGGGPLGRRLRAVGHLRLTIPVPPPSVLDAILLILGSLYAYLPVAAAAGALLGFGHSRDIRGKSPH